MALKHTIRKDDKGNTKTVTLNPLKAIRAFCLECVCWQPSEVQKCTAPLCPLFPYRFGKNPSDIRRKRELFTPYKAHSPITEQQTTLH